MFDTSAPSKLNINIDEYKDKILGCWSGKNIGGTLGTPFEGKREMNDAAFYTQKHDGNPLPNDDLDLQLVWLQAAEEQGLYKLTPRIMGEYWSNFIVGPWNEYSACKANVANGLYPPLSGSCNNEQWKWSNGAWIRSEIWACLFPGSPDEAVEFAYLDSCCDHSGEGIYAEVFTVAIESAAFVEKDIRKLIKTALSKIPQDCRIARSVKLACELYDKKADFKDARNALVKDSEDLGWFQAPANIGFTILGLLYGEGDFSKSVCLATNCGDDTDCTAATAGALLGIIYGRSGIPSKWLEPIGESIKTVAINPFGLDVPKTLGELSDRVLKLALDNHRENPTLPSISAKPTNIPASYAASLISSSAAERRVWSKSPYELTFPLPFAELGVDYENGPALLPGVEMRLMLMVNGVRCTEKCVALYFKLPEGWSMAPGSCVSLNCVRGRNSELEVSIKAGSFEGPMIYLPVEASFQGSAAPAPLLIPFQLKGALGEYPKAADQPHYDGRNRLTARRNRETAS